MEHDVRTSLMSRTLKSLKLIAVLPPVAVLFCDVAVGQSFREQLTPFLDATCRHCHDEDTETSLDLSHVSNDLTDDKALEQWVRIYDRIRLGEMPPASEPRPAADELKSTLGILRATLHAASLTKQQTEGRVPARRLTKREFGNTIRDLLLINGNVTGAVPDEAESGGFDTVAATQRISAIHLNGYLKAIDAALAPAVRLGPNPFRRQEFDFLNNIFMNAFHELPLAQGGSVTRPLDGGVAMFIDADYLTRASNFGFHVEAPGVYRITSTASAFQSDSPVTAKLIRRQPGGQAQLLGAVDLTTEQTETLTVEAYLQPGDDFYLTVEMGPTIKQDYAALVKAKGAKHYRGKGIIIKGQQVEGPLFEGWPPPSTRQLLHGVRLDDSQSNDGSFQVQLSAEPLEHITTILNRIAPRVLRRPTVDGEIEAFADLARPALEADREFLDALNIPLRALLSSPQFLLLSGDPGPLDDFSLASRLSFFLWSSTPDVELLSLAKNRRLSQANVLDQQIERMLNDKRSDRFVHDFVGQWLRVNKVNATTPDKVLYPEYDELLGTAIPEETTSFIRHLIRENLSATFLIDSDFTFVNSRLAKHYGLPGVFGQQFRRVDLPPDSPRGGVLTHAAILKTTANGTVTSPVVRGNFVLTNFLGTPPPPPPPSVGSVEPSTQGASTIREILDAHRDSSTCNTCHKKIDPPGFALECFDPIGGYRTHYRISHQQKSYSAGVPVDCSGVTAGGAAFNGIDQYRQLLRENTDQVVRNFISQLIVYATGGEIQFADRHEIQSILDRTRADRFPVRDIIHEVIRSRMFQCR